MKLEKTILLKSNLRFKLDDFYAQYKKWNKDYLKEKLDDIFYGNVQYRRIVGYTPEQCVKFYRIFKLKPSQKVKKSFFYERKDKDKNKIKQERFNLDKEQVLYLTVGTPAICLKETNCVQGDEILLIEYVLKDTLEVFDFSYLDSKEIKENCLTREFVEYFSRKIKECDNDYYITNYIKKCCHMLIRDGILYSSVFSSKKKPCPNVCLEKGVAKNKMIVSRVFRGTVIEFIESLEAHINDLNCLNFFSMNLHRIYFPTGPFLVSKKIKDKMLIATTNSIQFISKEKNFGATVSLTITGPKE